MEYTVYELQENVCHCRKIFIFYTYICAMKSQDLGRSIHTFNDSASVPSYNYIFIFNSSNFIINMHYVTHAILQIVQLLFTYSIVFIIIITTCNVCLILIRKQFRHIDSTLAMFQISMKTIFYFESDIVASLFVDKLLKSSQLEYSDTTHQNKYLK